MKKIQNQKSLKLGKEVVRALGSVELQDIAGGQRDTELQCDTFPKRLCA